MIKIKNDPQAESFHLLRMKSQAILAQVSNATEGMQAICDLLKSELPTYHWVGFYMVDGDKKELVLGPFAGKPTDHIRIPFGKGICGQSAETQETFLINDVKAESNYIACSIDVKSEIVVPLFKEGKMIGQIDIDSSKKAAFNTSDESFLKDICAMVAEKM
ncbi:MAG: L-methionine (R)-S-oxide reductase [Candidatus Azotimanducaceae bacterium]|jgi:L-methionine (R)-S-oxide reductase